MYFIGIYIQLLQHTTSFCLVDVTSSPPSGRDAEAVLTGFNYVINDRFLDNKYFVIRNFLVNQLSLSATGTLTATGDGVRSANNSVHSRLQD